VCWIDNPPLEPVASVGRVVTTGTGATHLYACHNPPTEEEAVAGRPLREGFVAAAPPGTVIERLIEAEDVAPAVAEEVALFDQPERDGPPDVRQRDDGEPDGGRPDGGGQDGDRKPDTDGDGRGGSPS
jgi:hypothetical protein